MWPYDGVFTVHDYCEFSSRVHCIAWRWFVSRFALASTVLHTDGTGVASSFGICVSDTPLLSVSSRLYESFEIQAKGRNLDLFRA